MKIKARPDDADMLESNELFQMNGWLAELRDEGRAETWDEDRSGVEEHSYAKPRGDGRTGSRSGGRTGSRRDVHTESPDGGRTGSRQDSHTRPREDGRTRLRDESRAESRNGGRAESRGNGHRRPREDGHAGSGEDGRAGPPDHGQAGSRGDVSARPRDDGQARPPWRGYPRAEALAATPVTTPVTRTQTTARAVIGDQLRLPIMWCEMGFCISWFAHPAALGEADIRARAIDAGWRVDAVGLIVCPQCVQTAPGFRSPLPVTLWDRQEAISMSAQMADEPGAEAVASVARELSHDLRRPASDRRDSDHRDSDHRDKVGAASAWIAAVPADDVARSASAGTSDEVRHPADDHQAENHSRPGRHRKRLAARLTFASH